MLSFLARRIPSSRDWVEGDQDGCGLKVPTMSAGLLVDLEFYERKHEDRVGVHKNGAGGEMELRHRLHEMTTAQESESSYHFHRNLRSISFGVEYATAFWDVSQSRRGFGAADSAAGGGCGPGIGRTALSRTGDRSTVGALADSRSSDRGGLVHAPGSRIGGVGFSVLFLGLPRTGGKRAHDRYTGCHRIVRRGCLFGRCQAVWKAQVGGRAPAR